MPDYVFSKPAKIKDIDISSLSWDLKNSTLADALTGVSFNGSEITIHSSRDLTAKELNDISTAIESERPAPQPQESVMSIDEFLKLASRLLGISIRISEGRIVATLPKPIPASSARGEETT